ncbi:MAG: glycerophosphodiester phosphodiesterase family protein [Novosphingobium sp.]
MVLSLFDRWLSPPPKPERVRWLRASEYAHRGLHLAGVPENSPSAFAGAIARGMGIECDVQRSRDGQAVVFHDADLDRLTAESGKLSARTAAELGKITISGSDDTIPTLAQLLAQIGGKVPLLIEIKSPRRAKREIGVLCLAVKRALEGYLGPHAIMSFDPRAVRWFRQHSPLTVRGLVVTEENEKTLLGMIKRRLSLWAAKPDFLAYDIRDLPSRFAAAQQRRGLPLLTWTVRSEELRERALVHADAPIAEGAGVA